MIKYVVFLCLLACVIAICNGASWIRADDDDAAQPDLSNVASVDLTPVESKPDSSSEFKPVEVKPDSSEFKPVESQPDQSNTNLSSESSTDSTTTTTEKPVPKTHGCAKLLMGGEGAMYCWTRCTEASTSSWFNTWCFTTPVKGDNSTKVACKGSDDVTTCKIDWPCKSSCGVFSPHWDREDNEEHLVE